MEFSPVSDPRIIIALDEPDLKSARRLVEKLGANVSFYKIGLTLLGQGGLELARELGAQGKQVFQDWKLHDIGAQVEGAAEAISATGCDFLTVHAEPQVMRAAVKGRSGKTKILGVTVLTSLTQADLTELGYGVSLDELVLRRVDQAVAAGIDGVVASPQEAALIRARVPENFLIVTPGVRPEWSDANDQKRISTPRQALEDGATHLVIGRPVTRAPDPVVAVKAILAELQGL